MLTVPFIVSRINDPKERIFVLGQHNDLFIVVSCKNNRIIFMTSAFISESFVFREVMPTWK